MILPLPRGIERDDTVHGRLYYSRQQIIYYGDMCFAAGKEATRKEIAARKPPENPDVLNELFGKFGIKK